MTIDNNLAQDMPAPFFDPSTQDWPPSLRKAIDDTYTYMMCLKDGRKIKFTNAEPKSGGEWVHITLDDEKEFKESLGHLTPNFHFGRGIDVRVSEIVWCADCDS